MQWAFVTSRVTGKMVAPPATPLDTERSNRDIRCRTVQWSTSYAACKSCIYHVTGAFLFENRFNCKAHINNLFVP
jgi:hypothetical protein